MDFNGGQGSGQSTAQIIDSWMFVFEFIMNQLEI